MSNTVSSGSSSKKLAGMDGGTAVSVTDSATRTYTSVAARLAKNASAAQPNVRAADCRRSPKSARSPPTARGPSA